MKTKGAQSIRRNKHNKKARSLKSRKQRSKRSIRRSTHKKGGKRRRMMQMGGGKRELIAAILEGDLDTVEKSIRSVTEPDKNIPFAGPFVVNATKKLRSTVEQSVGDTVLVNEGSSVNVSEINNHKQPVYAKIDGGWIQAQYLTPNPQFALGRTALYLACRSPVPNPAMVELLLDAGFNPNIPNNSDTNLGAGSYPLHGVVQAAKSIIEVGKHTDATLNDMVKIIDLLKPKGANLSAMNIYGMTAFQDYLKGVKPLINSSHGTLDSAIHWALIPLATPGPGHPPPYAPPPYAPPSYAPPPPSSYAPSHPPPPHPSSYAPPPPSSYAPSHPPPSHPPPKYAPPPSHHPSHPPPPGPPSSYAPSHPPPKYAHPPSHPPSHPHSHAPKTWFGEVFGFEENNKGTDNFKWVKQNVGAETGSDGDIILKTPTKKLHAGKFTMESLEALTRQLKPATSQAALLTYKEMNGDIKRFHQNPLLAGSLFQVASQFNMLEMASPDATPSHGITIYEHDGTQGPACAMACPAGTLFRNYFVNGTGQDIPEHQLDGLMGALSVLEGTVGPSYESSKQTVPRFWTMRNGYCFPTDNETLKAVSRFLAPAPAPAPAPEETLRRKFMNAIRYGIQWNTEVVPIGHRVAQIYCSALPIAYNESLPVASWKNFATAVLDAAYEATLAAGALLSQQRGGQRVKVFLTRVGGGVFGNPPGWIKASIDNARNKFKMYPLDVIMVNFTQPNVDYVESHQPLTPAFAPAVVSAPVVQVKYKWQWENDEGTDFNDFDVTISNMLETAYNTNSRNQQYIINLSNGTQWSFNFENMMQINTTTNSRRMINRVQV